MYKTTDDEVLGKGCRTKFIRYSSSPEIIKKKDNTNKSNKTKKKDEYSKRTYLLLILI